MKEPLKLDTLGSTVKGFKESRVKVKGQEIYSVRSERSRNGVPIIMIHGAIVSHVYFMPTAAIMAESHPVLVPDLPGHGFSSKPLHALAVPKQARILRAWLKELGLRKVIVMANSYGCEIAVEMAVEFPEVVERLVLISPSSDPHEPNIFLQFIRLVTDGFLERPEMFLVLLRDMFFLGWPRAFETAKIMMTFDYLKRLPRIKVPTLVLHGQNDPIAPQSWVEEVTKALRNGKLVTIPNGPHNIQFGNAKDVAAAVNQFLDN